jgi:hypothetical protein
VSRRVLLDENVNVRVKNLLPRLDTSTVYDCGVDQLVNGALLTYAREHFEFFVTHDRGIPFQHNHKGQTLVVIVLATRSTELERVEPLIPSLLETMRIAVPGLIATLSPEGLTTHHAP